MSTLYFFLTIAICGVYSIILYFLISKKIEDIHKRVDNIFTVDKPTPNEASKDNGELLELEEQNILNIPPNIKFEVEGSDQVPIGYEEQQKN